MDKHSTRILSLTRSDQAEESAWCVCVCVCVCVCCHSLRIKVSSACVVNWRKALCFLVCVVGRVGGGNFFFHSCLIRIYSPIRATDSFWHGACLCADRSLALFHKQDGNGSSAASSYCGRGTGGNISVLEAAGANVSIIDFHGLVKRNQWRRRKLTLLYFLSALPRPNLPRRIPEHMQQRLKASMEKEMFKERTVKKQKMGGNVSSVGSRGLSQPWKEESSENVMFIKMFSKTRPDFTICFLSCASTLAVRET